MDRRRFAFAQAGELWMSDVMHGPTVAIGDRGQRRKAFLDARHGLVNIGFRAFEGLHETPCGVEEHAGNVVGRIVPD
jgi:hypothetical protein